MRPPRSILPEPASDELALVTMRCLRTASSMGQLLRLPTSRRLRWFLRDELLPRCVRVLRDTADLLCALRRLDDRLETLWDDASRYPYRGRP